MSSPLSGSPAKVGSWDVGTCLRHRGPATSRRDNRAVYGHGSHGRHRGPARRQRSRRGQGGGTGYLLANRPESAGLVTAAGRRGRGTGVPPDGRDGDTNAGQATRDERATTARCPGIPGPLPRPNPAWMCLRVDLAGRLASTAAELSRLHDRVAAGIAGPGGASWWTTNGPKHLESSAGPPPDRQSAPSQRSRRRGFLLPSAP